MPENYREVKKIAKRYAFVSAGIFLATVITVIVAITGSSYRPTAPLILIISAPPLLLFEVLVISLCLLSVSSANLGDLRRMLSAVKGLQVAAWCSVVAVALYLVALLLNSAVLILYMAAPDDLLIMGVYFSLLLVFGVLSVSLALSAGYATKLLSSESDATSRYGDDEWNEPFS